MTNVQTNSAQFIGRKRLDIEVIEFQSDDLYGACKAVEPFLERLVLVGGWAFRVLMNLPNNELTNKRIPFTKDADFAVQISVKSHFEDIREHLLQSGFQNRDKRQYSFQKGNQIVEIIPFGTEAKTITEFELPEYELAFEDNRPLIMRSKEGKELSLRVISVATLVVHKIFAYTDRPTERRKDLDHLAYLLEYFGKEEDKYGLFAQLDNAEPELVLYELASAHLVRREMTTKRSHFLIQQAAQKTVHLLETRINQVIGTQSRFSNDEHKALVSTRLHILSDYLNGKYR